MIKRKNIVVIGGGFSGMVTAYFASKIFKKDQVILIEKNNFLGGLYNSVSFKNKFFFDHGMHLFYQCKNKVINNFFFKLLKKKNWIILKGVKKDIAGVFYKGNLKTNSPYIDLNHINDKEKSSLMKDIYSNKKFKTVNYDTTKTLKEYFLKKFGNKITKKFINPIVQKFWGHDSKKIDSVASRLILMDRINLFSEKIMKNLIKINFLRSRLSYPNQLKLPKKYQSNQKYGLYPRKFGMFNVIRKFEKILKKSNIKVFLDTSLDSFFISKNRINKILISKKSGKLKIDNISNIFWTVPIFGLIPLLQIKLKNLKFDKNKKQVFVYFLSKERPKMGGNYYFMCFDNNFATFRVTSYFEYCKNSKISNKYYPLCMELHFKNDDNVLDYKKIALKELSKFNIFDNMSSIKHVFLESATGFFPTMTLKNTSYLKRIKNKINNLNLKNLFLASQSPERGIFFMHDVLDQNINLLYKLKDGRIEN